MRLPRPRFTIRLIMVVVAIIALVLSGGIGAVKLVRRTRHFRQLASDHANQEQMWRSMLPNSEQMLEMSKEQAERTARLAERLRNLDPGIFEDPTFLDMERQNIDKRKKINEYVIRNCTAWIDLYRDLIDHHARLRQKYSRAAAHPWEAVPTDPSQPQLRLQSPGLQD